MKCDKCGYDYGNSGDSAHICGPVMVGDVGVPMDARILLGDMLAKLDEMYEFKNGAGAAYWDMAYTLSKHIQGGKK